MSITGIIGAMSEEIEALLTEMKSTDIVTAGKRQYWLGYLWYNPVVLVMSRYGKVAAATTATTLITRFGVSKIIFTGVAGSADPGIKIGDIVVGTKLYQHDMDSSPLYPRHHIPLLDTDVFHANIVEPLADAAERYLGNNKVHKAPIASGDKFFANKAELEEVKRRLPDIACVEMEGAAVAQVCYEHDVPFGVIRTISDSADEKSPGDFSMFVKEVASRYSLGILKEYYCPKCLPRS